MSIYHMNLVMNHYSGPAHLKLTLLLLADHAGENGECYPSYETLAARLCCSERSAIRNVKQLVDDGYLDYAMRGGRVYDKVKERYINASNTFRIIDSSLECLPKLKDEVKRKKQKLSTGTCAGGDTDDTPRGDTDDTPRGDTDVTPLTHKGGDTDVTLTINRTIINNHHRKKSVEKMVSQLSQSLVMPQ